MHETENLDGELVLLFGEIIYSGEYVLFLVKIINSET